MKKLLLLLLLFGAWQETLVSQSLQDSLILHLRLDSQALDISGYGNHGNVNGATPFKGLKGQPNTAYFFDGTNDVITVKPDDFRNQVYTFSIWVRVDYPMADDYQAVLIGVGGDLCSQSLRLSNKHNGKNGFILEGNHKPGFSYSICSDLAPGIKLWSHVVAVKTLDSVHLFVDGIRVRSLATPQQNPCYAGIQQMVTIGCGVDLQQFFTGTLDEVRVYKRPLSGEEIRTLHEQDLLMNTRLSQEDKIHVYPNPSDNGIYQIVTSGWEAFETVEVFNFAGEKQTMALPVTQHKEIDLSHLPGGMYLLRIKSGDDVYQLRLLRP